MSTPMTPPSDAPLDDRLENEIELKEVEGLSQGQIVRRRFFRHKGAILGLVMLGLTTLLALTSVGVGPVPGWWEWTPYQTPSVVDGGRPSMSLPTWLGGSGFAIGEHPFGQDEIGRDIFARVMAGVQTSLMVMVVIGGVSAIIGIAIGAAAGFFRGRSDTVLMRLTDLVITVPTIVIGAVVGKIAGTVSGVVFAVAMGLILWTTLARLVRGEFLSLREREFVDAARVAGASNLRIIFKHILPNAIGTVIVSVTLLMSSAILLETALSFLGFGIVAPEISLGQLINQYQQAFATRPWLFWWPGLFIIVIALSINFIGDGLRDAFDPRQKRIPSERKMAKAMAADAAVARATTPTVRPADPSGDPGTGS
ncbi:binding-protein-dependent transport systems inner membrane component [Cellulomonas flavigena DSM 20109]|uniref:Binding-protein-dependent transport systems inner membrane component n=1 Tax=Cellulomonas flavigena (strain ATCC 482 / DSM 20109 / BCRC 11376 / JCM 18109 / NBRC 3775 / NCIMB 8073 / NRS 134) TaxID=446466 RepID=D5UKS1_CELFN|nr:ABC transporter permease [Cellulomonas flavigena]ADG73889.1 binding-protein-dependent transport systems inner membrane component [Cellulomonas flavigena DSM 20109]